MTLFYLLVDPRSGALTWADAGHAPAIRYNFATDEFSELSGDDIPLGVDHSWHYENDRVGKLDRHDVVLLGTDGIWILGRWGRQAPIAFYGLVQSVPGFACAQTRSVKQ